jgi:tRNA (guanine37-N1)-methyltransferase
MTSYDVLGNILVAKFPDEMKVAEKRRRAEKFLKEKKSVRTVVEKIGKFSGRLRTQKTKWLAGEKTKEVLLVENGCSFRLNVDTCYFSPRLSTERERIAKKVRRGERVLVLFGGVAPFAVVIAKTGKAAEVVSVELGREPSKYALENVKRNKISGKLGIIQGDARRMVSGLRGKWDRVVMARPRLKDSFLDVGLSVVKKGGVVHWYGFGHESEKKEMVEGLKVEAGKLKRRVRVMGVSIAGRLGPGMFRWRVDLKVG